MEYTIKLDEKDLQVLNMAIGELPFKMAAPFVQKLNEQLKAQEVQDVSKNS